MAGTKSARGASKRDQREQKRAARAEADALKQQRLNLIFLCIVLAGVVPSLLIGYNMLWKMYNPGYIAIDPSTEAGVAVAKQVFLSGQPWMLGCFPPEGTKLAELPRVREIDSLINGVGHEATEFKVARADCNAKLPSGKTIADRFGLTIPASGVGVFILYNGEKAVPVNMNHIQETGSWAVTELNRMVEKRIEPPPLFEVTTSLQLSAQCLRKRQCVLLMHTGPMSNATQDMFNDLRKTFRAVRFTNMDRSRYVFSLESKLPKIEGAPADEPRLVYFRQPRAAEVTAWEERRSKKAGAAKAGKTKGPKLMAKAHKGLFSSASSFLQTVATQTSAEPEAGAPSGATLVGMSRFPTIVSYKQLRKQKEMAGRREELQKRAAQRKVAAKERKRKRDRKRRYEENSRKKKGENMDDDERRQEREELRDDEDGEDGEEINLDDGVWEDEGEELEGEEYEEGEYGGEPQEEEEATDLDAEEEEDGLKEEETPEEKDL